MPVVTVWGVPEGARLVDLHKLAQVIKEAIASISELKVLPENVTVFFPSVQRGAGQWGQEIVIFIEGLFQGALRTPEVRQTMADAVGKAAWKYLHPRLVACNLIKVIPRSQRPDDGYAKYPKDEDSTQSTDPTSAS